MTEEEFRKAAIKAIEDQEERINIVYEDANHDDILTGMEWAKALISSELGAELITTKTEGHLEYAPIVRCMDCKGYTPADETYGTCYAYKGVYGKIKPTDYCSYGERKEQENESRNICKK